MMATAEMSTFARLKQVIDPLDIHLQKSFMRDEIPGLFNLEFNTRVWQSGYVCPKNYPDQFLLVTLNKQGKIKDHQYHDNFIDQGNIHWKSQNSAAPNSAKGKAIIGHASSNSRVHQFVCKNKPEANKGAPFYYCGDLRYLHHKDEKPMNVEWLLERALSEELLEFYSG